MRPLRLILMLPIALGGLLRRAKRKVRRGLHSAEGASRPQPALQPLRGLRRGQRDVDTTRVQPRRHHHETRGNPPSQSDRPELRICPVGLRSSGRQQERPARHVPSAGYPYRF